MQATHREVVGHLSSLSDRELLRLVAIESEDYEQEAVLLAVEEIGRRRLEALDKEGYWKKYPLERIGEDGFCEKCRSETINDPSGKIHTINSFLGPRLRGFPEKCAVCGSYARTLWFCLWVPLFPMSRLRVIYISEGLFITRFKGRRLR